MDSCKRLNMTIRCKLLLLIFLILSVSLHAKQNILILHSYNQSYKWTNDENKGINSILKNKGTDIKLFVEYMDTKRYVNELHYKNLLNTYTNKYQNIKFDLIISSDNNAFNFLKKHNKTLFKGAPVVFCGVNYLEYEDIEGFPNFTGITEKADIKQNYELIKKLHPNIKNIYTIIDTTTTGERVKKEALEIFEELSLDGVNYNILDDVTFEELKLQIQNLPPNSALLLSVFFRDKNNHSFEYDEISQMISNSSKIPLYGLWDFNLGNGIIGGYLTSGLFQGKAAASMGIEILNGAKVQDVKVKYKSPNNYMFDYSKILKYNINPNLLPNNSFIINKQLNFYEIYKKEIITLMIIFLLMFILIIMLLINIQKRKKAEIEIQLLNKNLEEKVHERTQELEESNHTLEHTIKSLKHTHKMLVESEKMASLGGLVAGVAHEINTPVGIGLTGITHFLDITKTIKNNYDNENMSKEDFEEYLKTSEELATLININLDKTAHLVNSFKQVAVDQTSEEKRVFNIKEYISEILLSLNNILKKTNLDIKINCDENIKINSYPGDFSQILTNLIINSIRHGYKEKGKGVISLEVIKVNEKLTLIYKDDGRGIPKKNLPKIFDPFFTTNREQGGTGLGLNIIYNIITSKLNGNIICNSKEGYGVEFIITINS